MEYREFEEKVVSFFCKNGWNNVTASNCKYLEKNYNSQISHRGNKYLLSDMNLYNKLNDIFKLKGLEIESSIPIKNKHSDTDFVIAGLQKINDYLSGDKEIKPTTHNVFQPVIRLKNMEDCGIKEGYISSFVNICTIDVDTSIDEYLFRVDQWISILSALSLHTSGLRIILKDQTTSYNGVGVEFNYRGIDLGQANLYEFNMHDKHFFVTDIGFGYERILWLLNNLKNFYVPLFPKYEILNGDYSKNDKIRTATLMVMNGVLPEPAGTGSKCRKLLKNVYSKDDFYNLEEIVEYYYKYYTKFLEPCLTSCDTISIISNELNNLKKQKLCLENSIKYQKEESLEDVCGKIILKKIGG